MRHTENPGVVWTVYSGIIQGHSAIFNHVQAYRGTLRQIEAYLGKFRTLCNPRICNRAILRTLAHNPRHLQKPVEHLRWSGIFIQAFSRIFRDIQGYWFRYSHTHGHALGRGGSLPCPFLKIQKSVLIVENKALIVSIFGLSLLFKK